MAVESTPPAPGVPGVPAGSPPVKPVATVNPPVAPVANGGPVVGSPPAKPLFGGNVGGRPLPPGMRRGSPEHLQLQRDKDAQRKRDARVAKAAALPPPPLPPSTAPVSESVAGAPDAAAMSLGGEDSFAAVEWLAADFDACSPEIVELLEAWAVESNTSLAAEGGLPEKVVRQIERDSAFPKGSKDSLRRTSPAMLAKFANAVKLPVTLKPYISGIPSVAIIAIGQFKLRSEIRRLIEEDRKLKAAAKSEQGQTSG